MRLRAIFACCILFLVSLPIVPQEVIVARRRVVSGGSPPTFVNSGADFTGGGALNTGSWHPLAGNHLVVWSIADDRVTTHTCSDNATGGSNTYVADGSILLPTGTTVGRIFHVKTISNSGASSLTITCTGTTPAVMAVEYSGGTGDLDTTSAGTNPSSTSTDSSGSPQTPTAFTPTTAATILVDGYGSSTGSTITLSQVDGSFTTRQSCLTGATCFVGAIGTRVVASSASYSDGWTTSGASGQLAILAAYK